MSIKGTPSGFRLGSGCFSCRNCGKLTRKTTRSETPELVCDRCWEVGSCENGLSDAGYSSSPLVAKYGELEQVFKNTTTDDEVYDLYNEIHDLLTA
jgi:hypothetical protein